MAGPSRKLSTPDHQEHDKGKERCEPAQSVLRTGGPATNKVLVRFTTQLTPDQYVNQQEWKKSKLLACPRHPRGGCTFHMHGTYGRKWPEGMRIRRHYCRTSQKSFSLIPDFLAARVSGCLHQIEDVVAHVEDGRSQQHTWEQLTALLRPQSGHKAALRWIQRRVFWVKVAFAMLAGPCPNMLLGLGESILRARVAWRQPCVLVHIHRLCQPQQQHGAAPTALGALAQRMNFRNRVRQQSKGPAP